MLTNEERKEKAAQIAKEIAGTLKLYSNDVVMMYYAYQSLKVPASGEVPNNGAVTDKGARRIEQTMKDALLKWEYATNADKKKVAELEQQILAGNEKIKALYTGQQTGTNP